jgi:hypothetical protein
MTLLEATADRLSGGKITELTEVTQYQSNELTRLTESIQRLEQALYSPEWRQLTMSAEKDFTRRGIKDITTIARIMRLKNPTIKRGVDVQRLYVWAQGVSISADDETVNEVIQEFANDERNKAELTSHQAYSDKEVDLQQDGNLFFRFFVNAQTGRTRLRTVDPQEIDEIICNPEDAKEPWLYRRVWTQTALNGSQETLAEYYPDFRFVPKTPATVEAALPNDAPVNWDTPVYHVAVNRMGRWGISEYYAALDWATAYKNFLEQLASVWSALARWAAQLKVQGGVRGVAAAKSKLNTTAASTSGETNPPPVMGSTFIASEGVSLQPFRTAGATMSAEDGRRLLLQAIAVTGFPETFYGDVSVGTLATAKSLDRPTELKILDRQALWADIITDILNYVLLQSAKAPQGDIKAKVARFDDAGEWIEYVEWGEVEAVIKVQWPPVVEEDVPMLVAATIDAATLKGAGGGIPKATSIRQLLSLLGVPDIDKVMELWQEEEEERAVKADEWQEEEDERAEKADELAAQFSQNGDGGQDDEQEEREAVWNRQVTAVNNLLVDLREVVGNGDT